MEVIHLIESLIRALMCLTGIIGNNWLGIRSLPRNKSAVRTNEILFINLAVSNLITNYLVDMPDTIADFAGSWFLGETYCGVFLFCADLSETSSIFTTFFISAFWHQKLVGSLKRGGGPVLLDSLCWVACLLAGSWTVAVAFSIPRFFFVRLEGMNGSKVDCVDYFPDAVAGETYDIIYLILANAVPLAGIVIISVQIVVTLLQNQRRIGHNAVQTTNGKKSDENRNYIDAITKLTPSTDKNSQDKGSGIAQSKSGHQANLSKPTQVPAKLSTSSSTQVRAAKSVVAVASVFLICWMTHLLLRISYNIQTSSLVMEIASYIGASYTSIIPYIFLHGVKKLSCSCNL